MPQKAIAAAAAKQGPDVFIYGGNEVNAMFKAGVFKSVDGGQHWTAASTGLNAIAGQRYVGTLAFDPASPTTLYAAVQQGGERCAGWNGDGHRPPAPGQPPREPRPGAGQDDRRRCTKLQDRAARAG